MDSTHLYHLPLLYFQFETLNYSFLNIVAHSLFMYKYPISIKKQSSLSFHQLPTFSFLLKNMKFFSSKSLFIILLTCASILPHIMAYANYVEQVACLNKRSPCFKKGVIKCPTQCPTRKPKDPKAKACFVNCDSPICQAECRCKSSPLNEA